MNCKHIRAISFLMVAACTACGHPSSSMPPSTAAHDVDPLFRAVAAELREHTQVPVLLPKHMPNVGQEDVPIYPWIKKSDSRSYTVVLSFRGEAASLCAPPHNSEVADSPRCRFATLSGNVGAALACGGTQRVGLRNGVQACYSAPSVGAGVGEGELTFQINHAVYRVAIKAGSQEETADLANAMIGGKGGG